MSLRRPRFLSLILSVSIAVAMLVWCEPEGAAQDSAATPGLRAEAEQIFSLANQARAKAGVGSLRWDESLAAAALAHCGLMAREGPIAHRYDGEPELTDRAAK